MIRAASLVSAAIRVNHTLTETSLSVFFLFIFFTEGYPFFARSHPVSRRRSPPFNPSFVLLCTHCFFPISGRNWPPLRRTVRKCHISWEINKKNKLGFACERESDLGKESKRRKKRTEASENGGEIDRMCEEASCLIMCENEPTWLLLLLRNYQDTALSLAGLK